MSKSFKFQDDDYDDMDYWNDQKKLTKKEKELKKQKEREEKLRNLENESDLSRGL